MRFYVGIIFLILGVSLITFSILFFNYSDLFEKLLSFTLVSISLGLIYISVQHLITFFSYKKLLIRGLKVKAKVIDIKKSIFTVNNCPNYIIEVIYEHPKNHEVYKTYVDCYQIKQQNNLNYKKDDLVEIMVDPDNPSLVLLK